MASPNQDVEINMPTAQIKKWNLEMKRDARLRFHEANIDWLNKQWQGPDWFPILLLRPSKPCPSVVRVLRNVTKIAMAKNILLSSLWEPGGCLRSVVDQDLAIREAGRNGRYKHPQSRRLTRKMVSHARQILRSSTAEMGNDCSSSSGSTTGGDSEVKELEKSNTVSRLSTSAHDSSAEQQLPPPLHGTVASAEDELKNSPRGMKRSLEDNEDEALNPPMLKSQRVALEKVLGILSPEQIEIVHRKWTAKLDTVLAAKNAAEKGLLDLMHGRGSRAVSEAERVQARLRKHEAEEAFNQAYQRLHRPTQAMGAVRDIKKTFDARALCALKLECAQKEVQFAKSRMEQAQANHEAALRSNFTGDCDFQATLEVLEGSG
ncbi:hypothetical protein FVEG_11823 [Fusarium verticillioides 7600]|uniref:Uncharacterized protein n=1 Tax=Gibberella moniliformis (strain M3125 / FGSC 7600) TaxID=334819 RepID=W7MZZ4_GIBM7|nr:hypothetical protein FVEG_11823 [Fusarium verticillioides 7600]EWG53379.1 hypothetical protein FVEG_11823 [Fusarium verticillioides 7600]